LGKTVIVSRDVLDLDEEFRGFFCDGGFGCSPGAGGSVIFGYFSKNGIRATIRGKDVVRLV